MSSTDNGDPQRVTGQTPRRLLGLTVLVSAVLVSVALAAIRNHLVPGEPVAQPVPAAPTVGDCVTQNPWDLGADLTGINLDSPQQPLPSLPTAPCTGSRFGDVASILTDFAVPTAPPDPAAGPPADPCGQDLGEYLGLPPATPTDSGFVPVTAVHEALIGPDPRQRAAGQRWAACIVYLPISIDAAVPLTVDHPLRGAWQRTDDSRLFAVCGDDPATLIASNCRWPHHFETLAAAPANPAAPPESVQADCRQAVTQALGSSAALDHGELTTQVVPFRPNPDNGTWITGPDAITADGSYFNDCLVTPTDTTRSLTAPLRGLGDDPAPLN